ncbi:hypothetical protein AYL99_11617 [Fonsecaea erecta]|uniref:Uncharacterized protein n=1 Tax=Fonsecaea erecta TaxID=1367422 RepID=A0A178Z4G4_9EURO|nr:hypothetical protein AYL99_11617 [Fonsecaea erecta]OAP54083.1 hypothetical protein AYL99_11617 [Fonsecaea erecta]
MAIKYAGAGLIEHQCVGDSLTRAFRQVEQRRWWQEVDNAAPQTFRHQKSTGLRGALTPDGKFSRTATSKSSPTTLRRQSVRNSIISHRTKHSKNNDEGSHVFYNSIQQSPSSVERIVWRASSITTVILPEGMEDANHSTLFILQSHARPRGRLISS